jgi:predicted alpha-1,2-mannosidase
MLAAILAIVALTLTAVDAAPADATAPRPDRFVNPFVGTQSGAEDFGTGGGAGNTFPGAVVPFGMVQFSPDTWPGRDNFAGGYSYGERRIKGFGLTHFSGAGCGSLQDVPMLPTVERVDASPAVPGSRYMARRYMPSFSHSREHASPGDYSVELDPGTRRGIGVELTATTRTGLARLRFPAVRRASVLFDAGGSKNPNREATVWIDRARRQVAGMSESGRFCGHANSYRVYFVAQLGRDFSSFGTWRRRQLSRHSTHASDSSGSRAQAGAYVTFDTTRRHWVDVRIGVSFTSLAGARRNLRAEAGSGGFGAARDRARREWNAALGRATVSGGTTTLTRLFYTSLYHALLHPNVVSDVDGTYLGMDGRRHQNRRRAHYANFSGWDVYRSQQQLIAMLFPRRASDIAQTLVDGARESGCLPRWSFVSEHTSVMVGDPAAIVLATDYALGARRFDTRAALAAMLHGARRVCRAHQHAYTEREGLADYLRQGYIGFEHNATGPEHNAHPDRPWGSAATTLEYAAADFAIGRMAAALGRPADSRSMLQRSANWRKLLDPAEGAIVPRYSSGAWLAGYRPGSKTGFVEGNGAQYTWFVPYDPAGLFGALGGPEAALRKLDSFFTQLNAGPSRPYAFLGNEPSLAAPWLYDWAGQPYRTQDLVRRALLSLYRLDPDGMPGNDDGGTLSAWWVFGALGLYPPVPGEDVLALGSPLFPHATLRTGRGTVTIDAPEAGADRPFVQSMTLNGRPWTRPWLRFWQIVRGARMEFSLGPQPNATWGTAAADAPPSRGP